MLRGVCVLVLAACANREPVPCELDADCDLANEGWCELADTVESYCSYPSSACAGGRAWSDVNTPDELAGTCVPAGLEWSAPVAIDSTASPDNEAHPILSADGIDLYFSRYTTQLFEAHRASASTAFGSPTNETALLANGTTSLCAVPNHTNRELFVDNGGELTMFQRNSQSELWSTPIDTDVAATCPSFSADDLTMYYTAGCPQEAETCLYTAKRLSSTSWSTPVIVAWGDAGRWRSVQISGDQLSMLVSGSITYDSRPISVVQRRSISSPWMHPRAIVPLSTIGIDQARADSDLKSIVFTGPTTENGVAHERLFESQRQ